MLAQALGLIALSRLRSKVGDDLVDSDHICASHLTSSVSRCARLGRLNERISRPWSRPPLFLNLNASRVNAFDWYIMISQVPTAHTAEEKADHQQLEDTLAAVKDFAAVSRVGAGLRFPAASSHWGCDRSPQNGPRRAEFVIFNYFLINFNAFLIHFNMEL